MLRFSIYTRGIESCNAPSVNSHPSIRPEKIEVPTNGGRISAKLPDKRLARLRKQADELGFEMAQQTQAA